MIKALIIDDERLARVTIATLLKEHASSIAVIGEADCGNDAITKIEKLRPELIFLDIHLPDVSGLALLEKLSYQPKIIFTTAYHEYAIEAFEKMSIDYLLKPISQDRFNKSVQKLKALNETDHIDLRELLNKIKNSDHKVNKLTTIPVKNGAKIILLDVTMIAYFKSEDKYVTAYMLDGDGHLLTKSITELAEQLPDNFFRVHRSYIVNMKKVLEVEKYFKGTLILSIDDKKGTTIKTGESYSRAVKERLGIA